MNITTPQQRTTSYHKFFFPQSINDWNALNLHTRNSPTIISFKDKLKSSSGYKINPLYHQSPSNAFINQTRIRLGLSGLSSQRHDYKHITDPKCQTCNARKEDPFHYFVLCPTYNGQRPPLLEGICDIFREKGIEVDFRRPLFRNFLINTILRGTDILDDNSNKIIFTLAQTYIRESHRFP